MIEVRLGYNGQYQVIISGEQLKRLQKLATVFNEAPEKTLKEIVDHGLRSLSKHPHQ